MSQIHFIGGEKGGVGKSLVSRVLAQYFIDRGLPFLGFDTDRSHGALLRFYGDYASPVASTDTTASTASSKPRPKTRSGACWWTWRRRRSRRCSPGSSTPASSRWPQSWASR